MKVKTMEPDERLQTLFNAYARKAVSERPGPDLEADQEPEHRDHAWASQIRECTRQMYLDMTASHKLPPFDAEVIARMDRGNNRERDIGIDLTRVGQYADPPFQWIAQQEYFSLNGRNGTRILTGKMDGKIRWADGERWPAEIKSWHPNLSSRLRTFNDVLANPWARRAGWQLLVYLFGTSSPWGLLVLDMPGLPHVIRVHLYDYLDEVEAIMSRVEEAVLAVRNETGPPPYTTRIEECSRCPFYALECNPPKISDPDDPAGLKVIQDDDAEGLFQALLENKEAADAYAKAKKLLAQRYRGVQRALCGPYGWSGKWTQRPRLELPENGPERQEWDAIKERQDKLKEQFTFPNPEGAFSFEVFRLDATPAARASEDALSE